MQFTFNTSMLPDLNLGALISLAVRLGYAGIEVHWEELPGEELNALLPLEEATTRFSDAGIVLAGISTTIRFGHGVDEERSSNAVRRAIDCAEMAGAPRVRVLDTLIRPGQNRDAAAGRLVDRLLPLADRASDAGVMLLVQNALSLHTARDLWILLEQASHPSLGCAWDVLTAALAGEKSTASVPVLNSRIGQVILRDVRMTGPAIGKKTPSACRQVSAYQRLGEGELAIDQLVRRLSGIGFSGMGTVEYPMAFARELEPGEGLLTHAIEQLKNWTPLAAKKKHATKGTMNAVK